MSEASSDIASSAIADFLWVIYETENELEIEPNEKFDTKYSKWTGGTA